MWTVFSSKRSADVYIAPRMMGGSVKVSLHESGSWQVGLSAEGAARMQVEGKRHWEIFGRGPEMAPGLVRGWYLIIPDCELRLGPLDAKAYPLPPVGRDHAVSVEVLLAANEGSVITFDHAHIVGRWMLAGRNECCLIVARRIAWQESERAWADKLRTSVMATAHAAGIEKAPEHRYFLHGHNSAGVRFGLELAAE